MITRTNITYRRRNLFSGTENKFLYFISDVSHLLKTAKNSLPNSGSGKFTLHMWNDSIF